MSAKPESLMCDSRVRGSVPPTCEARDSAAISPPVEIDLDGVTGFTRSKSISTGGGPRGHGGGATPSQFSNMGSAIFLTTVPCVVVQFSIFDVRQPPDSARVQKIT